MVQNSVEEPCYCAFSNMIDNILHTLDHCKLHIRTLMGFVL